MRRQRLARLSGAHASRVRSTARRGGLYVAVLSTSTVVMIIGLSSLAAVSAQREAADAEGDFAQAVWLARSGLELGLQHVAAQSDWRATLPGVAGSHNLSGGQVELAWEDPTGDLLDDVREPLTLVGTGRRREAQAFYRVMLTPRVGALTSLNATIHANNISVNMFCSLGVTGGKICANSAISNSGVISGNTESATYSGYNPLGTKTAPAPPKAMPPSGVIAQYTALATPLDVADGELRDVLLAPGLVSYASNAHAEAIANGAATNASGVYVVDTPATGPFRLQRVRVYGTLIIRAQPGVTIEVRDDVLMSPASPNMPALLIQGDAVLRLRTGLNALEESESPPMNLNPSAAPYQGASDSDQTDLYPSELRGLIYVNGNVLFSMDSIIRGTLICTGNVAVQTLAGVIHDPNVPANPPAGFLEGKGMQIVPGSWERSVLP